MDISDILKNIISEILDIDKSNISNDTYLIRELGMESIDLLELSVSIASSFKTEVDEDMVFLKDLRYHLDSSKDFSVNRDVLLKKYPHLRLDRIEEILKDVDEGPVLKFKDVVSYLKYNLQQNG